MSDDLIADLRALHVWPQSVADERADALTPRQIAKLYEVGNVAHRAADRIASLEAEVREARKHLDIAIACLQDEGICGSDCIPCSEARAYLEKHP